MRYEITKAKYLSDSELEALESLIKRFKDKDVRNILIIEIALRTGARASEILNLKKSDLDSKQMSIYIHGLKDSKDREIPLKKELFMRLYNYAQGLDGEKIFPISYSRLNQIWSNYKPGKKKFHSLRHTFALNLYVDHHNLRLCQIALGHRSIKNTIVYADYTYDVTEMRKYLA